MPLALRMLPIIVTLYQDIIFSKKLVLKGNIDIDRFFSAFKALTRAVKKKNL